jgi:hypothetical protein
MAEHTIKATCIEIDPEERNRSTCQSATFQPRWEYSNAMQRAAQCRRLLCRDRRRNANCGPAAQRPVMKRMCIFGQDDLEQTVHLLPFALLW